MTNQSYRINAWVVEPHLNKIRQGDKEITLVPKVMKLLNLLASRPMQVITQDELIEVVWEGQSVTDSSLYQAVAKLRKSLGDDASNPSYIEKISGSGYRLIAPVVQIQGETGDTRAFSLQSKSLKFLLTGVVLVLVLVIVFWLISDGRNLILTSMDSNHTSEMSNQQSLVSQISTMTFIDLKLTEENPPQAAMALNDILLTQLSRIEQLSLVHLKHEQSSLKTQAVMRGKITRQQGSLRVFIQIEDIDSQQVIWAKYYQGELNDLFSLQDQIVENLLDLFQKKQANKLLKGQKIDSALFEEYLTARGFWEQRTPQSLEKAKEIFERIKITDKLFPLAAVGLCDTYLYLHIYSDWKLEEVINYCEPLLHTALKQQPNLGEALAAKGMLLSYQKKFILAQESFEKAIQASPNYYLTYLWYGNMIRELGRYPEALSMIEKAFELSPMSAQVNRSLAYAFLNLRRVTDARHYYDRSLELDDKFPNRAVADLDFYELNTTRALAFLVWTQEHSDILKKRPNYQLTESQVLLSLGEINRVEEQLESLKEALVNPSFFLYMQASLASVNQDTSKTVVLLRERLMLHKNNQRFILPYILALYYDEQYEDALANLNNVIHIGNTSEVDITLDNHYILSTYIQIMHQLGRLDEVKELTAELKKWYIEQPVHHDLAYANWQIFIGEKSKARIIILKLMKQGWLPDFNAEVFPIANMKRLFIQSGLGEQRFLELLQLNREQVLKSDKL